MVQSSDDAASKDAKTKLTIEEFVRGMEQRLKDV